MKPLGERNAHFWLAQRMAKISETDLVAAMEKARLTQADWADIVQACRGCDWTAGCKRWLDRQSVPVDSAPEPCVNRDRFNALKQALEELDT